MFRRPIIVAPRTETRYVTREVHEHRAPTDESVKLLREMERAAETQRVAGMVLGANEFKGAVEVMRDPASFATRALCTFDLNGRRLTAKAEVSGHERPTPELMTQLRDAVALKVANEMLGEFVLRLPKPYPAQVDTPPKGGDALAAPFRGSAVPEGDAP